VVDFIGLYCKLDTLQRKVYGLKAVSRCIGIVWIVRLCNLWANYEQLYSIATMLRAMTPRRIVKGYAPKTCLLSTADSMDKRKPAHLAVAGQGVNILESVVLRATLS
jgi:hypothetical protein